MVQFSGHEKQNGSIKKPDKIKWGSEYQTSEFRKNFNTGHFQFRFLNGNDHSISGQIVQFLNDLVGILLFTIQNPDWITFSSSLLYERKYFFLPFCITWSRLV
jgi:hypothetical protein